ncbi:MAG: DUF1295 domain-containing protein [Gammaproteobacteria bacterium]|nr:DUF1295 domain-containing protein [Gammaproteobacteria bacterium]
MYIHLLISFLTLQLWMLLIWTIFTFKKNAVIADVAWGLGIMGAALFHQTLHPSYVLIFSLMIWALRLSGFIFWTRLKPNHQDVRYEHLKKSSPHSSNLHFLINCQFQGCLQWLIAIPFLFPKANTLLTGIGMTIFSIGFLIESIADFQLQTFKKKHPHQVCNIGLWQYSRHPNYFGELLIWFGFALCFSSNLFAFLSPISLYLIMTRMTGPLTEEMSLRSKGKAYKSYQKKTPMIIPNLKKIISTN